MTPTMGAYGKIKWLELKAMSILGRYYHPEKLYSPKIELPPYKIRGSEGITRILKLNWIHG